MRQDMAKVIVERPRLGGAGHYPRGAERVQTSLDDWQTREGIRHPWRKGARWAVQKELNENLAPLRRFLRSSVGRPWDKVYGEICERINRKSAVQLHIWQHLRDYVCTNSAEITGEVGRPEWRSGREFYVDPNSGILRESRRLRKRDWQVMRQMNERSAHGTKIPWANPVVPVNDNRCYELIDGIWYDLELRKPPADGNVFDPRLHGKALFQPRHGFRNYRGRRLYVAVQRRLDEREARRVGRELRRQVETELSRPV
jgi:hypothetical protein